MKRNVKIMIWLTSSPPASVMVLNPYSSSDEGKKVMQLFARYMVYSRCKPRGTNLTKCEQTWRRSPLLKPQGNPVLLSYMGQLNTFGNVCNHCWLESQHYHKR